MTGSLHEDIKEDIRETCQKHKRQCDLYHYTTSSTLTTCFLIYPNLYSLWKLCEINILMLATCISKHLSIGTPQIINGINIAQKKEK